jgi:heme oxygenase
MLKGRAGRDGYALFLFNLAPAYRFLEEGLRRHRGDPRLAGLVAPELFRHATIVDDLAALVREDARQPARLPAGQAYAARVAAADPARLIAHAYVRYLGDLSGGRILGRLLARAPGIGAHALGFYDFPAIADPERFRDDYRRRIDRLALTAAELEAVGAEACAAFRHNIRLSMEVAAAVSGLAAWRARPGG